ncbi:hypothetical protein L1987_53252 [Smallanthus sonchifolius]|uniref:Uncharacterized protein n=1 Tax=Smallanthus sonchifolius TaxID=185202 RepID=A0ACB9EVT3_9ASTR|nr:hypothetical protein L1987_53252 [Smallanthus sonchifolius]
MEGVSDPTAADRETFDDTSIQGQKQLSEVYTKVGPLTQGVDEEILIENLPEDLQIDISRHRFIFVKNVQIFARMNQPVLDAICERIKPHTYIKEGTTLYKGGFVTKMVFIVRGKMESKGEDGNSVILSDGDVCGEELLTWCLEPSSLNGDTRNKLVSKRTVTCLTKVEAFVLQAADLEQAITRSDAFPDESSEQISIVVESGGNHHSGDTEIQEEEA